MRYSSFVSVALKRSQHEALTTAVSKMPVPVFMEPRVNKVVLKPSIYDPNLAGNTTIGMVEAVTQFFRSVAPVIIVESDNPRRTAEAAFTQSGYDALASETVSLVNLSSTTLTEVDFAGTILRKVHIPQVLLNNRFLVNIAAMKTQEGIGLSAGIKNLFGLLPIYDKTIYHEHLEDVILDLLVQFRPSLSIIDLTSIVVGRRELSRTRHVGGVIVGLDPVAVDSYCAQLLGLDPMKIGYLKRAAEMGLGEALPERIQVLGTEHQIARLSELCAQ
jgi:uncharacterized protein (DUF362 family)